MTMPGEKLIKTEFPRTEELTYTHDELKKFFVNYKGSPREKPVLHRCRWKREYAKQWAYMPKVVDVEIGDLLMVYGAEGNCTLCQNLGRNDWYKHQSHVLLGVEYLLNVDKKIAHWKNNQPIKILGEVDT